MGSQSVYSFYGSRLHLYLDDELAAAYNRAAEAFYQAQHLHHQFHETPWNPSESESLEIDVTPEEVDAWNKVGKVINLLSEINEGGLQIPEEEITDDYLVKVEP